MGVTERDVIIDHISHDKMDNRRANLRKCTNAQNIRNGSLSKNNTSGVTGVYFDNNRGKWHAQIRVDRKAIFLGRFDSFDEAVAARREAEKVYFGEFASNLK